MMEQQLSQIPEEIKQGDLLHKLAGHMDKDVSSDEVQHVVQDIIAYALKHAPEEVLKNPVMYCTMIIESYSNGYLKAICDTKYGAGSADYIVEAFQYYVGNRAGETD